MSAKVTSVITTISETDLMENIREFVAVEGLTIHNVEFKDNSIEVTANYKKLIDIPFYARVHVASVANNIIRIRIEKIKVLKLGIPNGLLSAALGIAMKKAASLGISYDAGHIVVDVDEALQKVPHVHLMVDNIVMENGVLAVKISSIYADVKALQAEKEAKEAQENEAAQEELRRAQERQMELLHFNQNISAMARDEDEYAKLRRDLARRIPKGKENLYEYGAALPDLFALAVRVMRDPRVLPKDKIIIGLTGGYFLLPIDIIPQKVPILNALDDLAFFVFGVNHLINRLPLPIVVEHWSGELTTLKFLKDNIGQIMSLTGSANMERVYGLVDDRLDERFGGYKDDDFYFRDPVAPTTV
ncbi:hypothetical protein ABB02_01262 [Clostridiaceae bacterium JG1575]|nr:hypothetical protein ABB02_01262 [Clostridiaceae bacterium JG1575]